MIISLDTLAAILDPLAIQRSHVAIQTYLTTQDFSIMQSDRATMVSIHGIEVGWGVLLS